MLLLTKGQFERALDDYFSGYTNNLSDKVTSKLDKLAIVADLSEDVKRLRNEVNNLENEKSRLEEDKERQKRELEHKAGLLKIQVEEQSKIELAKKELEIEKRLFTAEKKAVEDKLDYMQRRMEAENKDMKQMLEQMLKRLPSAEILVKGQL